MLQIDKIRNAVLEKSVMQSPKQVLF